MTNDIDAANAIPFDALLIVSYGGPEHEDEVVPFIKNVLAGRKATPEQIEKTAEKYRKIGNVSPINEECRSLISGLLQGFDENAEFWLKDRGIEDRVGDIFGAVEQLPIYWGNLFWHPLLEDTIAHMAEDGVRRVVAFFTVPFGTEHSMRSYNGAIDAAVKKANVPDFVVRQTRLFYNHPYFISTMADRLAEKLINPIDCIKWDSNKLFFQHVSRDMRLTALQSALEKGGYFVLFTAHSVPVTDAQIESYQSQMKHACSLVADLMQFDQCGIDWDIAYQSHGGPRNSWCGPDVAELVKSIPERFPDKKMVIVCPIGFMLENMELIYDLDVELRQLCESLGLEYDRTLPVSAHRKIIAMIRELVAEVYSPLVSRRSLG